MVHQRRNWEIDGGENSNRSEAHHLRSVRDAKAR